MGDLYFALEYVNGGELMKSLSFSAKLLVKEIKKNPYNYVKQYIFFSILFAIIVIVYTIPLSYEYIRVFPFKKSTYDLHISGPLYINDLNKLLKLNGISQVACIDTWDDLTVIVPKNNKEMLAEVIFVKDFDVVANLLPDNPHMLIKGNFDKQSIVVTSIVADRLRLNIGDEVTLSWANFKAPQYSAKGVVSGIISENLYGPHLLADYNIANNIIPKMSDIDFTSMYIKFSKKNIAEKDILSALGEDANITFEWRTIRLNSEINEVNKLNTSSFNYIKYGLVAIYFLLFIGYSLIRLKDRSKLYAILSACGAQMSVLRAHFFIDIFLLFSLVTSTGVILAKLLYRNVLLKCFPIAAVSEIYLLIVISMILLIVITLISMWKLNRASIADILTKENVYG
jgi:ABC-type lipoprotein release transport system permease subunit